MKSEVVAQTPKPKRDTSKASAASAVVHAQKKADRERGRQQDRDSPTRNLGADRPRSSELFEQKAGQQYAVRFWSYRDADYPGQIHPSRYRLQKGKHSGAGAMGH